jgi:hypothetical protein
MIDYSYLLLIVGVFVLAFLLDYWLTIHLRIWQKMRADEVTLSTADQVKQTWQRVRALISDLSTRLVSLKQPRCLKAYSLFGGTIFIAAGLFLFAAKTDLGDSWIPWVLLVAGLFLFISKLPVDAINFLSSKADSLTANLDMPTRLWQSVCLFVSPFFAYLAVLQAGDSARLANPVLAVAAWILSIVLAILGAWHFPAGRFRLRLGKVVLSFVFISFVAFFVRSVNVTHIPPVLTGDEGSGGLSALGFLNGKSNNIFSVGWYSFPSYDRRLAIAICFGWRVDCWGHFPGCAQDVWQTNSLVLRPFLMRLSSPQPFQPPRAE